MKIWGPKNFLPKRNFGYKQILGPKKFRVWKNFWQRKLLSQKKLWVQKNFVSKIFFLVQQNFETTKMVGSNCGGVLFVLLLVILVLRTPNPLNSAKSTLVVFVIYLRLLVQPLLIDFGGGSWSCYCCCCCCDRDKTKSTPRLSLKFDNTWYDIRLNTEVLTQFKLVLWTQWKKVTS